MATVFTLRPRNGISATDAIHRLLRAGEAQIVGEDFHDEQHDVDVVEEIQVDVRDVEDFRIALRLRKSDPQLRNVVATKHAQRRVGARGRASAHRPFAVEKIAHVREERHEFAVMPLLEVLPVAPELVLQLAPRVLAGRTSQDVPRLLNLRALANRHHLKRPDKDLPEVVNRLRHVASWLLSLVFSVARNHSLSALQAAVAAAARSLPARAM